MLTDRLPAFVSAHYECHEWRHASAILSQDFPSEWADLIDLLSGFRLNKSWITVGGGNKSRLAAHVDAFLTARGWAEKQFQTAFEVDGQRLDSPTHKVDCFKNRVALDFGDDTISRIDHAIIVCDDRSLNFRIYDGGKLNPIHVNSVLVTGERELAIGDVIELGSTLLRLEAV